MATVVGDTSPPFPPPLPPPAAPAARSHSSRSTRSPFVSFSWTIRDYAKRVWDNAGENNALFLAGGIAFNILLAVVPFVLLLVWFLTFLLDKSSANASEVVTRYLDRLMPQSASPDSSLHRIIREILSAHTQLGIWSGVTFVWFSTRLFGSLRTVLANVFDIESERGIIEGKIFDVKITIVSTILITGNTLISTYALLATSKSIRVLEELGIREDVMGTARAIGTHAVASMLLAVMFFALYKYLPIRRVRTKTAWVAALFTTVMFELAKLVFATYVRSFNPGTFYAGTASAVVVLVVWVYYAALIFILGGEVGQVYELRRTRKRQREVFLD